MNEQMTTAPLLPETISAPILLSEHEAAPVYYERRISFAPNTYVSNADYTAEAFAPVIGLGEVATKFVASAVPVEGTYHQATAADMQAAFEAYANNGVSPQVAAEVAARKQQDMLLDDLMASLSETDGEDAKSNRKVLTVV